MTMKKASNQGAYLGWKCALDGLTYEEAVELATNKNTFKTLKARNDFMDAFYDNLFKEGVFPTANDNTSTSEEHTAETQSTTTSHAHDLEYVDQKGNVIGNISVTTTCEKARELAMTNAFKGSTFVCGACDYLLWGAKINPTEEDTTTEETLSSYETLSAYNHGCFIGSTLYNDGYTLGQTIDLANKYHNAYETSHKREDFIEGVIHEYTTLDHKHQPPCFQCEAPVKTPTTHFHGLPLHSVDANDLLVCTITFRNPKGDTLETQWQYMTYGFASEYALNEAKHNYPTCERIDILLSHRSDDSDSPYELAKVILIDMQKLPLLEDALKGETLSLGQLKKLEDEGYTFESYYGHFKWTYEELLRLTMGDYSDKEPQ